MNDQNAKIVSITATRAMSQPEVNNFVLPDTPKVIRMQSEVVYPVKLEPLSNTSITVKLAQSLPIAPLFTNPMH